jgi:hypothetical protein
MSNTWDRGADASWERRHRGTRKRRRGDERQQREIVDLFLGGWNEKLSELPTLFLYCFGEKKENNEGDTGRGGKETLNLIRRLITWWTVKIGQKEKWSSDPFSFLIYQF